MLLSLAQQQQTLHAILKGRPVSLQGDPWLGEVRSSKGLRIVNTTIAWWQRFQIELQCRYTSRLLKRLGCFDQSVQACFRDLAAPPSIEELGTMFLRSVETHEVLLARVVARFELICLAGSGPGEKPVLIEWDRNPADVILALDAGAELPPSEPGARYMLRIGGDARGAMSCVREELAP